MASSYSYLAGLSSSELEKRAAQNSADWHTDVGQRSSYEAENKAIKAELDKRNGTTSTLDTTTGKWTTTGEAKGGTASKTTPSEILALGQGPLSSAAAANYVATGSTNPTTASTVIQSSRPQQAQGYTQAQMDAMLAQQAQQTKDDLTEYLRQQKAAEVESALAGLKGAYEQSMAGYKAAKADLPKTYDARRNSAAAQDALARRTFDERAAAQGLSSGAAGQADLARSAALTGALSQIDQAQTGAEANIDLQMTNLESQYQTAIQKAQADGNSQLATALYQELVRVQGLQREDEQLAYNREQAETQTAYRQGQTAKAEAQERINTYLAALGQASGLDSALVEQSGYTPAELTALEQYYAQQAGASTKPTLTAAQVGSAIKAGNLTPNVLSAYEYYYGVPYGRTGGVSGTVSAGTGSRSNDPGYDNGSLTTGQVKKLQTYLNERNGLNLSVDGLWGADSRAAAGGMPADEVWQLYIDAKYEELLADLAALRSGGATAAHINSVLANARAGGIISADQQSQLRGAYVGSGR